MRDGMRHKMREMLELRRTPAPTVEPIQTRVAATPLLRSHVDEEGQALVEFAVSLPILLLIVTGILTFGAAMNNYLMLTNATSSGARKLAISRGQTTDPCATLASAVYASAPTLQTPGFSFAYVLNGVPYSGASCNSSSSTTGAAGNLVQGQPAQVTVTYPCSLAVFGINYAPGCTLQAQSTEFVQ